MPRRRADRAERGAPFPGGATSGRRAPCPRRGLRHHARQRARAVPPGARRAGAGARARHCLQLHRRGTPCHCRCCWAVLGGEGACAAAALGVLRWCWQGQEAPPCPRAPCFVAQAQGLLQLMGGQRSVAAAVERHGVLLAAHGPYTAQGASQARCCPDFSRRSWWSSLDPGVASRAATYAVWVVLRCCCVGAGAGVARAVREQVLQLVRRAGARAGGGLCYAGRGKSAGAGPPGRGGAGRQEPGGSGCRRRFTGAHDAGRPEQLAPGLPDGFCYSQCAARVVLRALLLPPFIRVAAVATTPCLIHAFVATPVQAVPSVHNAPISPQLSRFAQ